MPIITWVCLWKNNTQIHEWEWEKGSEESCSADWDHRIDPEYLKFLVLYEQSKRQPQRQFAKW